MVLPEEFERLCGDVQLKTMVMAEGWNYAEDLMRRHNYDGLWKRDLAAHIALQYAADYLKGFLRGELIGYIRTYQKHLGLSSLADAEFEAQPLEELRRMAEQLEHELFA